LHYFQWNRSIKIEDDGFYENINHSTGTMTKKLKTATASVEDKDITERNRGGVMASDARYRNFFESSRDAIMTLEPPSWRFTTGNPAAIEMFKAKNKDEFVSCKPWKLSPERQPDGRASDEKAKEMIAKAMREGSNFFEWTHKRISGEEFPATVLLSRVEQDENAFLLATVRDITEHKLAQEKLLASEKLAVMGRITADVSHEINNPLAIILSGTQLVLNRLDKKSSPFKKQLETVLRSAKHCKTILGSLLGYNRTIGKKEEIVNLPALIREAIQDVNYQYDMSGIETVLNCNEIANAEITGNSTALLSVFVNLIRNARQAMGEKGRLTITMQKEDKKHLRIEIHDTGSGMSDKQKAELFKPFASGWKERDGSGLGLATSLGIIETHGGSISAESGGVGKGATFTILLPCEFKDKK